VIEGERTPPIISEAWSEKGIEKTTAISPYGRRVEEKLSRNRSDMNLSQEEKDAFREQLLRQGGTSVGREVKISAQGNSYPGVSSEEVPAEQRREYRGRNNGSLGLSTKGKRVGERDESAVSIRQERRKITNPSWPKK